MSYTGITQKDRDEAAKAGKGFVVTAECIDELQEALDNIANVCEKFGGDEIEMQGRDSWWVLQVSEIDSRHSRAELQLLELSRNLRQLWGDVLAIRDFYDNPSEEGKSFADIDEDGGYLY